MVRLLVVEDHALVREGLVQTLRQLEAGVEVCDVADATSAIEMLDAGRGFDMMLLDLGLPGVDGMTCLSMLRKRFPQLPVVILSGYDDAHTVSRALKAGAAGFVPKTYSSDICWRPCGRCAPGVFIPLKLLRPGRSRRANLWVGTLIPQTSG